jgi:hypothetical protein
MPGVIGLAQLLGELRPALGEIEQLALPLGVVGTDGDLAQLGTVLSPLLGLGHFRSVLVGREGNLRRIGACSTRNVPPVGQFLPKQKEASGAPVFGQDATRFIHHIDKRG